MHDDKRQQTVCDQRMREEHAVDAQLEHAGQHAVPRHRDDDETEHHVAPVAGDARPRNMGHWRDPVVLLVMPVSCRCVGEAHNPADQDHSPERDALIDDRQNIGIDIGPRESSY